MTPRRPLAKLRAAARRFADDIWRQAGGRVVLVIALVALVAADLLDALGTAQQIGADLWAWLRGIASR